MKTIALLILSVGFLLGCKDAGKPALLIDHSDAAKRVLNQQIAIALNATHVLLAPDAFFNASEVVIERGKHRSISGQRIGGRILTSPDRFQLRKRGRHCGLVHMNTGKIYPLEGVACRELDN